MKTAFVLLIAFLNALLAVSCAKSEAPEERTTDDFRVQTLDAPPPAWTRPTDCRANIRVAICLADPVDPNAPGSADNNAELSRPCDPRHSLDYAPAFEALYDSYPPHLQKMFCSLRRIFVERGFFGSAYAGAYRDKNNNAIDGAIIGVRQSLIENPFSLTAWGSWKEQLNFGGDPKDYALKFPYPTLSVANEASGDFMSFVFAHEFGHLFDFKNNINQYLENQSCAETDTCPVVPNTWAALSWVTNRSHLPTSDFSYSTGFCFYGCTQTLSPSLASAIYPSFANSNFISTYASTNSWDDFAETLAYHYVKTTLKKSIVLSYGQGQFFDATARLESPHMKAKLDYVEHFLQSSPAYP